MIPTRRRVEEDHITYLGAAEREGGGADRVGGGKPMTGKNHEPGGSGVELFGARRTNRLVVFGYRTACTMHER